MSLLSKDYDGFGKFSGQILAITLILIIVSAIPGWLFFPHGLLFVMVGLGFFIWGMYKQHIELNKRNYAFHNTWIIEHPEDAD